MRIEDYALIGDCETAALIGRDGSLDWLCWPRFDSPACFAALLGKPQNGRWLIRPRAAKCEVRRQYRRDTLILETTFETADGAVTLIDFMPLRNQRSDLMRIVRGVRGRVKMEMEFILRFDYGSAVPWVTRLPSGKGIRAVAGPEQVVLCSPVELEGRDLTTHAEFDVSEGEDKAFVITHCASYVECPPPTDPAHALRKTEAFWRDWISHYQAQGEWGEPVRRSLITLKALTYAPTGGVVAAPTTSLPELLGGVRNWDYRFCWLRDATLTLLALMNAGYFDEAGDWREWLVRAVAGAPAQMQIMYGLAGERRLPEWEIPWLSGYEDSAPVRVGNAAADQLQLDVYGEVMDTLHQARKGGLAAHDAAWDVQRALLEHLETVWDKPDEGMWEVRGPRRHFTYSKIMCWVAFDRGIKAGESYGLECPVERWRELRARIHDDVCRQGYNGKHFVQSYGSDDLDASLLLIPLTGFLPANDARVVATVEAIRRELTQDGFVLRYRTHPRVDGLPQGEGVFLACSFWLVDTLCMQGRWNEARQLFEKLVALRNDVGLLSEEYDPRARRLLGNFPQAFSHVALINSATGLARNAPATAEQRAA